MQNAGEVADCDAFNGCVHSITQLSPGVPLSILVLLLGFHYVISLSHMY
jgi:hypothetical protein